MRALVLAVLILLVAASAAGAAPPWSAPRDASPPAAFLTGPGLVAGPGGDALLSWNTGEPARGHLSTLRADGTIVRHGTLGGRSWRGRCSAGAIAPWCSPARAA